VRTTDSIGISLITFGRELHCCPARHCADQ